MRVDGEGEEVYSYEELSEKAKDKAKDWYRDGSYGDLWWEDVYEDAKEIGKLMGIYIGEIYFSGFWSQGDGACFVGSYRPKMKSYGAVVAYAPTDKTLHTIAAELSKLQRKYKHDLSAEVKSPSGMYYHSMSGEIHVMYGGTLQQDETDEFDEDAEIVRSQLRGFMDWIYARLRDEYEYLCSDEYIEETIIANEYEFYDDGEPYCG